MKNKKGRQTSPLISFIAYLFINKTPSLFNFSTFNYKL